MMITDAIRETAASVSRSEIERFLTEEQPKYQRIRLPYGLETPGPDRSLVEDLAFGENLAGESVLDVGSYLGAFCVEALQRGASRAVGLELNRRRIEQARTIARYLGLQPEYRREDIEDRQVREAFDVVLCLNVLHHLRDPIAALRYLAEITKDRLVLECAAFGKHDRRKNKVSRWSASVINQKPTMFVADANPAGHGQTYFFTKEAVMRILDGHMKLFQSIRSYKSDFKDRFILCCSKLRIDRMILVSGCNSSGKSTLCEKVKRNELCSELHYNDFSDSKFLGIKHVWESPLADLFSTQDVEKVVFHYDLSAIEKQKLHAYSHDPSTDLLRCVNDIDIVVLAPPLEVIKQQLIDSELTGKVKKQRFHEEHLQHIQKRGYLLSLYNDWVDFCERLTFRSKRYYLYTMVDNERKIVAINDVRELYRRLHAIYGTV